MGKGGKKRDWGYASVADDGNLIYTSYEKDGSVNRYKNSILSLEEKYGRNYIGQNLALTLRKIKNKEVL